MIAGEELARQIANRELSVEPVSVRRFRTGMMHYVFEATFESRKPVVIRIAAEAGRAAMQGAAALSALLRPRGVPLPEILASNLDATNAYLVLERLPGMDLGEVVAGLTIEQCDVIAATIVAAQDATAGVSMRGDRYGYAVAGKDAPHTSWSDVLAAHLARSRRRIEAAKIFDPAELAPLEKTLVEITTETNALPPTPFLHDTTTKNVIVTSEGRFSGIVDVDDLCFGDPRYVVALTRVALLAHSLPPYYADAWMRHAGFQDDRVFRVYLALFLADFMAELGTTFNGNETAPDANRARLLRQLFQSAMVGL